MFCHQCGSGVSDDAATCGSCGADLRAKRDEGGVTQPIPAPDATIRMAAVPSQAAQNSPAPLPATTILSPAVMASARAAAAAASPGGAHPPARNSAPLMLLFGAAVLLGIAGWGGYRWVVQRGAATPEATTASSAPATSTPSAASVPAAATPADATPAPAPAPARPADEVTPAAPPPAPAEAATPVPAGPTPAQLAGMRRERDAAITQRDAALDQVRQLRDDLAHARAASSAPAPVATPAPSPADVAKTAQLQKEHDTVRYVIGSRKQLTNDKVIESHLYLLPPPPTVTSVNLSQTTEISFDAKSYGVNNPKAVVVIPSSVWEDTDYRFSIAGSTVKFTILRPDAFRNFARYFVLMIE